MILLANAIEGCVGWGNCGGHPHLYSLLESLDDMSQKVSATQRLVETRCESLVRICTGRAKEREVGKYQLPYAAARKAAAWQIYHLVLWEQSSIHITTAEGCSWWLQRLFRRRLSEHLNVSVGPWQVDLGM